MNWPPKAISSSLNDVTSDLVFRNSVMNIECCSIYQINAAVEPQLWSSGIYLQILSLHPLDRGKVFADTAFHAEGSMTTLDILASLIPVCAEVKTQES
ncbi:hypothetical protein K0M31_010293 [Melipona bicolor]|uniref:Uncharacterized protein n=1 Tax=Melipona bicolor TaxID=60889 RepID=A0AA40FLQ7_9HYME|nr:hypothetical protein K0M31_010293 [Melipona bicolor]